MKSYIIVLVTLLSLVQCQGRTASGKDQSLRFTSANARDTSITPASAFTQLKIDSLQMENYLQQQNVSASRADELRHFYNSRNYQFAWFTEDGLAEHTPVYWNRLSRYLQVTKDSTLYNKNLFAYMQQVLEDHSPAEVNNKETALAELSLTRNFFNYAEKAYEGILNPKEMQWHIPRKKVDAITLLDSLVRTQELSLSDIEPLSQGYKALQKELLRYYSLQKEETWAPISLSGKKAYRTGDKGPVVTALKQRLAALGDLDQLDTASHYNEVVTNAVKRFQQRHGLKPDGVVGPKALQALNTPVETRIQQLLINMERQRWLPQQQGKQIVANIPEFKLHIYENGREVFSTDVVVGKAATRTVVFADELKYIVFSPYWNLPRSIVRNEVLPAMERNPSYLKQQNMEITGYSNGLPVIRQKPGKGNALGAVKFLFPNQYSIYFHDTPAKSLFNRQKRAFSHGCIRLQKPFEMAQYLLKGRREWTDERIRQAMNSHSEKWVTLEESIPVFIIYLTAWVDQNGTLNFRDDIYGHDRKMAAKLFQHSDH